MSPINHMKLAPNFKPHLAASKDTSRYILQHVCIRNGMAIATNGRSLVAGINDESDETTDPENVLVPLAAVAMATKKKKKDFAPIQNVITLDDDGVTVRTDFDSKTVFKRPDAEFKKYPDILKVLPEHKTPVSITFSVKLLKELSDAMGEESVCLTFDRDDLGKCMIVTPAKIRDRFGLLMPTRFGERGDTDLSENKALERLRKLSKETTV